MCHHHEIVETGVAPIKLPPSYHWQGGASIIPQQPERTRKVLELSIPWAIIAKRNTDPMRFALMPFPSSQSRDRNDRESRSTKTTRDSVDQQSSMRDWIDRTQADYQQGSSARHLSVNLAFLPPLIASFRKSTLGRGVTGDQPDQGWNVRLEQIRSIGDLGCALQWLLAATSAERQK
ncbi:hypothetical protein BGW80DRAFT_1255549 [Lactifluus volemus]|nr:hypothetical protein BGW80DRAFT_1255549 [Lactifluus volemus]